MCFENDTIKSDFPPARTDDIRTGRYETVLYLIVLSPCPGTLSALKLPRQVIFKSGHFPVR
jgi:hypothetical protein